MNYSETYVFKKIPQSVRNHFNMNFYAAVYSLINHIRCLSERGGEDLKIIFEKYPFLKGYFTEINQYMPENITWKGGLRWWEGEITAWEQSVNEPLPLIALSEKVNIAFYSRIALMIIGLVEEDSRFGTVFVQLQNPLLHRRPCLELVGRIMMEEGDNGYKDPWNICHPLFSAGLIDVLNRDAPRSEWVLRIPDVLWDVIKGDVLLNHTPWYQYYPSQDFQLIKELVFPDKFLDKLEQISPLVLSGKAKAIVLRGMRGSEHFKVIGSLARALGQNIITIDGSLSPNERHWQILGPVCSITCSMPVITYDMGPGETAELPILNGYSGPIGILMGLEGGLSGKALEKMVTLTLPPLKSEQRMRCWQKALAGYKIKNLSEISERFHIPGDYIRQSATMAIAHAALNGRETIFQDDIREACRALNHQMLDTLAVRLEAEGSWDRLIVSEATEAKLKELELRCKYREKLLNYLGPAFGSSCNRGVRTLFSGPSGTGKTLAAKILAAVLGIDIYRVDLAAVVNKYIGETEKNLHRILSTAEELDVILLLDEGDALLGKRTEVKSSNDRYANLETNYLLQRLENYQGIVIVTTNLGEAIDTGFQRRMDVVVNFVRPQALERWQIWQLHLPENHDVDIPYLEDVAVRCTMTGGQIRNAALQATMLALDTGKGILRSQHLEAAIQSEYRKAGAVCPLSENGRSSIHYGGMEAFLERLC
ncbi:MAG: AAA family ATPase [bacterium]